MFVANLHIKDNTARVLAHTHASHLGLGFGRLLFDDLPDEAGCADALVEANHHCHKVGSRRQQGADLDLGGAGNLGKASGYSIFGCVERGNNLLGSLEEQWDGSLGDGCDGSEIAETTRSSRNCETK